MKQAFYVLFGGAFTVASAWAMGAILFRLLRIELRRGEQRLLEFVTGSALLSGIVFLLCCTQLARRGVFFAVGAGAMLAAWRLGRSTLAPLPPLPARWKWILGVIFTAFTVLYFFNAMAPEMSPDGSAYHLVFPAYYYRAHGFVRIPWNMYANLTQGVELLFLYAYAFGRHSAAALVHFAYLVTLPWLMIAYGRRAGITAAAIAGALFFFVSPVVGIDGASAYVDVALAAVLFALFYMLQIWDQERDARLLVPIGILAGFSFEVKYTAVVALPYTLGFLLWKLWRARQPLLRPVALVAGIASLCIVPWLVKNSLWMADPVSPFADAVFRNPYIHVGFEREYTTYQRIYTLTSLKQIPLQLTVKGDLLGGLLGPLFLLAPLALLALRKPQGRQLLLAGTVFALPYAGNIGTRFLIPCLPFVSMALGLALMNWEWLLIGLVLVHAVCSWPAVAERYVSQAAWRLTRIPAKAALRLESEDSYLSRKFPGYNIDRIIEQNVPPTGKVFAISQPAEAYTTRHILCRYLAAPNEVLGDILWTPLYPEWQPSDVFDAHFTGRSMRKLRVVRTAGLDGDMWNVSELRVYDHGVELTRSPRWSLTAKPNPWEVQLAFDNSPVTRWRTWEPAAPGQYLEIDFGREQEVDEVRVETMPGLKTPDMRVEAGDGGGKWSVAGQAWERRGQAISVNLRRAAAEELKARGVRYLLIGYDDLGAEDFQAHQNFWGIHMLAEAGNARLYYIE